MNRFEKFYYDILDMYVDNLPVKNITEEDIKHLAKIRDLCQDIIFEVQLDKWWGECKDANTDKHKGGV